MTRMRGAALVGVVLAALSTQANPAAAACIPVGTPAALNNIRNNMTGDYCLTANINAAALGNFAPIGVGGPPADPAKRFFKGTLDGKGFAISNLKIDDAAIDITGFFRIIDGGTVKNIRFLNANVKSATRSAGVITGSMRGATGAILNSSATGKVEGTAGDVGGLAGACSDNAKITDSFFDGAVIGINSKFSVGGVLGVALSGCTLTRTYAAGSVSATEANASFHEIGGLVGDNSSGIVTRSFARNSVSGTGTSFDYLRMGGLVGENLLGTISESFAVGPVTLQSPSPSSSAGGLVGKNSKTISLSFATGPVTVIDKGSSGGIAGTSSGSIGNSYSTSLVRSNTSTGNPAGGLIGLLGTNGVIAKSFSAGKVIGTVGQTGGLVGSIFNPGAVTQSYWDVNTSGQSTSAVGLARTTVQLRAALQPGLAAPFWGITPQVTYPFISRTTISFWSTLATTVKASRIFAFNPISQRDRTQYTGTVVNLTKSSEATVYTMLARAIGVTKNVAALKTIKVNTTYWNDATQTTSFAGPITVHASRGLVLTIPTATPIALGNILGKLKANNVALICGPVPGGTHCLLATSYTVSGATPNALLALDPYTGQQVRINLTTKKVFSPANFPLTTFKVTNYRVITLL